MQVVYVSFSKLTDRIINEFNINHFLADGHNVIFLDVISLLRGDHADAGEVDADYLVKISNWRQLNFHIRANRFATFFMIASLSRLTLPIYILLSLYRVKKIYVSDYSKPSCETKYPQTGLSYLIYKKSQLVFEYIFDVLLLNLVKKINLVTKFEYIFAAGNAKLNCENFANKVVPFNSIDYENYIKSEDGEEIVETELKSNYIVYLDTFIPHHNDLNILKYKPISSECYYDQLNHFFLSLEKKHLSEVVIAAHPSAIYDDNPFDNRKIIRMRSANLVKHSKFVVADISSAVSYAILYFKPILLYTTAEINERFRVHRNQMIAFSNYLNIPIINLNNTFNLDDKNLYKIDSKIYLKYKYEFLTTIESEKEKNISILYKKLLG